MKNILLFFLLLNAFLCKAQVLVERPYLLSTDYPVEEEAKEIVLNYKDHGIKNFKIEYKETWHHRKMWKDVFYYTFVNDSTLIFLCKYAGEKEISAKNEYVIRGHDFYDYSPQPPQEPQREGLRTVIDSANTVSYNYFKIAGNDTVLSSRYFNAFDSLKRETLNIQWDYINNDKSRKLETIYRDDAVEEKQYTYKYNAWSLTSHCRTNTAVIKAPGKIVTTFRSICESACVGCTFKSGIEGSITENITIVYYDKNKLITRLKKVETYRTNNYRDIPAIDILTPVILKN